MKRLLPKSINNPAGFTLVELLVVITIIAILSVIGMAVFTNVQKNARDARRRSDIDAIANALEVNKTATAYVALATTHFSDGVIPQDPLNVAYCANTTVDGQPGNITARDCSAPTGWGEAGTTNPPTGTAWKICAYLENPVSAYCRVNAQ
ncbi:type II secretion system protein [Candidatus Daviesbacteria bacterium]|nr:type II secretion system protein [Candidatus Daviesbacteria bacterium]